MSENNLYEWFFSWLTYNYSVWFILFLFLFWLPRFTLTLGAIFLVYWVYWTSTLEENISELMKINNSISVAQILSDQGVSVENRANCSYATCAVYETINKLLEEGHIKIQDGSNIADYTTDVILFDKD